MSKAGFFVWKDSFALGIPMVDAQHQGFFDMLNELYESVVSGAAPAALTKAHNELKFYAAKHFSDEEKCLAAVGYSGVAEQRDQHAKFTRYLEAADLARSDARATLSFMKDWMLEHILGTDKRFEEWLKAQYRGALGDGSSRSARRVAGRAKLER